MILERLELAPFGSNCYIVGDETTKEGIVIDPGADPNRILKKVKDLGLKIKLIVLTHAHIDHIGALKEVKEATGADIAIHADDAGSLHQQSPMGSLFGISTSPPPPADRLLKDGDTIDISNLHFKILHTPGHSPGGVCILIDGIAFTGDTLFNFGIGRFDFPGSSGTQLMNSINTKLMVLPDDTKIYPGHGPDSTIGTERRGNPFLRGDFPF